MQSETPSSASAPAVERPSDEDSLYIGSLSGSADLEAYLASYDTKEPRPYSDSLISLFSPTTFASSLRRPPEDGIPLPCVIPQTTRVIMGTRWSPFVRAWVPELEKHRISVEEFVTFLDELNECFIVNPAFGAIGIASFILTFASWGFFPLKMASIGLRVATAVAVLTTSILRTKMYLKTANARLFRPVGLDVRIMTTKTMMAEVGHPDKRLKLSPLNTIHDLPENILSEDLEAAKKMLHDDPRLRLIEALAGYVLQIDLSVPDAIPPKNPWKRMGAAMASYLARTQGARLSRKDKERILRYIASFQEAETVRQRYNSDMAEPGLVDATLADMRAERDQKIAAVMKGSAKEQQDWEARQTRKANQIRWVVITRWTKLEGQSDEAVGDGDSQLTVESEALATTSTWKSVM